MMSLLPWMLGVALAQQDATDQLDLSGVPVTATDTLRTGPTTVVISGGASRGVYEAGFLYVYTEVMRAYRTRHPVHRPGSDGTQPYDVVTGASAGALNGILAAMTTCMPAQDTPRDSLFYRAWLPLHVAVDGTSDAPEHNLYDRSAVTAEAFLTRRPFDEAVAAISALMDQDVWVDAACRVDLGMVVTRVHSRRIQLQTGRHALSADRQTDKIAIRFDKPAGATPTLLPVTPILPDQSLSPAAQLYMHLGHGAPDEPIPFDDLAWALKASSGFPFAFSPVTIPHRLYDVEGDLLPPGPDARALFIDGGLLENLPVRLGLTVSNWRGWEQGTLLDPRNFMVLDPDSEAWQRHRPEDGHDVHVEGSNALRIGLTTFREYVGAARDTELVEALAASPGLSWSPFDEEAPAFPSHRLYLPATRAPQAASPLSGFMGFLERDFREFDFRLGMLEARHHARELFGEETAAALMPPIDDPLWPCFSDWEEASDGWTRQPAQDEVPQSCVRLTYPEDGASSAPHANQLAMLKAAVDLRHWTQTDDHDPDRELDQWTTYLLSHGFTFRDLGTVRSPDQLRTVIRDWLADATTLMSHAGGERSIALDLLTEQLTNRFQYQPPRLYGFVGLNLDFGVEAGVGIRAARWLRVTTGARFLQLGRGFNRASGGFSRGLTPSWLLRLEGLPMSSPVFNVEPFVSYELQLPVSYRDGLLGAVHVPMAGVHLVVADRLYATGGFGWSFPTAVDDRYDPLELTTRSTAFKVDVAFGVRLGTRGGRRGSKARPQP